MRAQVRLAVAAVSLTALLGLLPFPSGAGQHFGIIGDTLAWGLESTMQAEPLGHQTGSAQGFLIWGAGAAADDGGPSGDPIAFAGCVTVTTMFATDFGCSQDLRLPPPVFDPTMSQARAQVEIESDRFPGARIIVDLTFVGMEPFLLPIVDVGDPLDAQLLIAVGRRASVTGTVTSTWIGGTQVDTNGIIAKGGAVQTCSYDGTACA